MIETSDISINSLGASLVALRGPSPDRRPTRRGSVIAKLIAPLAGQLVPIGSRSARQDDHADRVRGGPNGRLSLAEARTNFRALGACGERCTKFVREPQPNEHPTA
ncbi:CPCC family cysteine-rich protein [Streptomyces sp. NBC_01230]|uniref:CPCC family cysteine-rich protein n=1 Tax=Streptomyces sp. NBC_01230 TaxID=2903784 RepID=UPI003FA358DA